MRELAVDGERLWQSLMELGEIGAIPDGGVCRLAGSDEDRAGRDHFVAWCEAAGLLVSIDELGNLFARRAGGDAARPPVVIGSHLDSQPTGGRFDGAYGVMAALEVVRTLNDGDVTTEAPVEVVSWTNEEGARFAPAMLASGVFAGAFSADYARSRTDPAGVRLGDELARIGYAGSLPCGGRPLAAYLEAHIEQGPVLEAHGVPVGVVTGVQGIRWFDVVVGGQEAHAGSTPMERRHDALVGAARLVTSLDALARQVGPEARATVGVIDASPASRNTIPGRVQLAVDLRHPSAHTLESMAARLDELAGEVGGEVSEIWYSPPVTFDPGVVAAVRAAAADAGLSYQDIVSGAGHDACYLATVCPTGMIFIPCRDGVSHNPTEWADPRWCEAGANVLLGATLALAGSTG